MSRAYRVTVQESIQRVVRSEDHVETQLQILEILPCDELAELLAGELAQRGFERQGEVMVRSRDQVTVTIDPRDGTVQVRAETSEEVQLSGKKEGYAYDDFGHTGQENRLRQALLGELEATAESRRLAQQEVATGLLEQALGDIQAELDQIVNRVTAEALKRKAAQIGQIREVTEDPESGNMTIVVEV